MKPFAEIEKIDAYIAGKCKECETNLLATKRALSKLGSPIYEAMAIHFNENIAAWELVYQKKLTQISKEYQAWLMEKKQIDMILQTEEEEWIEKQNLYFPDKNFFALLDQAEFTGEEYLNILLYLAQLNCKTLEMGLEADSIYNQIEVHRAIDQKLGDPTLDQNTFDALCKLQQKSPEIYTEAEKTLLSQVRMDLESFKVTSVSKKEFQKQCNQIENLSIYLQKSVLEADDIEEIEETLQELECPEKALNMIKKVLVKRERKIEAPTEIPTKEVTQLLAHVEEIVEITKQEIQKREYFAATIEKLNISEKSSDTTLYQFYEKLLKDYPSEMEEEGFSLHAPLLHTKVYSIFETSQIEARKRELSLLEKFAQIITRLKDEDYQNDFVYKLETFPIFEAMEEAKLSTKDIIRIVKFINHRNYLSLFGKNNTEITIDYHKLSDHLDSAGIMDRERIEEIIRILRLPKRFLTEEDEAILEACGIEREEFVGNISLVLTKEYTNILEKSLNNRETYPKEELEKINRALQLMNCPEELIMKMISSLQKKQPKEVGPIVFTTEEPKIDYVTEKEYRALLKEIRAFYDPYHREIKQDMSATEMMEIAKKMERLDFNVQAFFIDCENHLYTYPKEYEEICKIKEIMQRANYDAESFLISAEAELPYEENPIVRYLHTKERIQAYSHSKAALLAEYFTMIFLCDSEEYEGWKIEMQLLLDEIEPKMQEQKQKKW